MTQRNDEFLIIPACGFPQRRPRHIFAMKALAARERDVPDLRLLADVAGIDSLEVAVTCAREFFPDEVMPERARRVLAELFAGG